MADRYSFSLTTFSPSGKLVQIEYALNAVNQGVTALGIKEEVIIASHRSPSLSKISLITPDIGMVYAGMGPDYRVLVDKARKDVARVVQEATQSGGVRPYGVSLLIAGWDEGVEPVTEEAVKDKDSEEKPTGKTGGILKGGPSLYQATAIGKHATSAKTFLEKRYTEGLELEDAIHIALLTLKETIEGEMNGDTIEIGIVGPPADHLLGYEGVEGAQGPRFRKLTKEQIEDYLTNL
ncbi:hypothetical protein N7470_004457 [Penicillium chermesinum]|nr:hypothetical protein N7470_004457 [Penicillium chermesinum]